MKKYLTILFLIIVITTLKSQKEITLTLKDALQMAQTQSLQAFYNKHSFLINYWQYRSFKAGYLPSATLNSNMLNYSNSSRLRYNSLKQKDEFVRTENLSSNVNLTINQLIGPTGGSLYLASNLGRIETMGMNGDVQYSSTPIRFGYSQNLFGVNECKWDLRISPLEFEKSKIDYLESVESSNATTVSYFFQMALTDMQLKIVEYNYATADTLLKIAQKRYLLGTVTKDELIDLKLNKNNAFISLQEVRLNLRKVEEDLLIFLMLSKDIEIKVILPVQLPDFQVNADIALNAVLTGNPQIIKNKLALLNAEKSVLEAKARNRFSADMSLSFGLSKDDYNLGKVYQPEFDDYQTINMGITVPILDWGNGKGQVQMAISQQKLQEVANQQIMQELEQNTITQVLEFNIQKSKVESAALSDSLAAESFELTMDRFRRGSVDVLKLVSSQQAKDNATVKFVSALSEFWSRYYLLRKLTLTDIENGEPLDVNFEELVQY